MLIYRTENQTVISFNFRLLAYQELKKFYP